MINKCGTTESCYSCTLRPDDSDLHYGNSENEKLGKVAEAILPSIDFEVARQLSANALGARNVSDLVTQKVLDAARIRLTPACTIRK
ncbi:MAG TPA: hypothetical protein VJJ78_04015 [Candidatus Saccharimonadales bacterium]|nr:hypothetical protein [Candidatus Saccharimonadales bacterium]